MAESDSINGEATNETFVSALNKKYKWDETLETPLIHIHLPKSAPGKTACGDLVVPEHLALNYKHITEAGEMSEIASVIANVLELDLSMNLLSQWDEVFKVISYLPKIRFLNLSNNPLHLSDSVQWSGTAFTGLRDLVLNAAKLSWNTIWTLLSIMPQLQELHLSMNEISTVELAADQSFPSLTVLYMNGNTISSWKEVERLSDAFPSLTNLLIMNNPLSNLSGDKPDSSFRSLKYLNLGHTQLSCWEEVEKLKRFPCLTDIKLLGVPFLEKYEEKLRRFLLIGYLPKAERLNGSEVSKEEREDAERAFIRHYLNVDNPPARYDELVAVHGHLEPLVEIDFSLKDSVTVRVHFRERSCLKQFSIHDTALDVKKILASELVKRPHQAFDLYHHDVGSSFGHSIMNFPKRALLSYRVKDGDEIFIELK